MTTKPQAFRAQSLRKLASSYRVRAIVPAKAGDSKLQADLNQAADELDAIAAELEGTATRLLDPTNPMTTTRPFRPFDALRTDAKKAAEGVWITHPESGDQFRVRRRFGDAHATAYVQAREEHEAKRGAESSKAPDADKAIDAIATARALIVDWKLAAEPERPYDAAEMAEALQDPGLADLQQWLFAQMAMRKHFRPADDSVTS